MSSWTSHENRPTHFYQMVGNSSVKQRLLRAASQGRLPNIICLSGPTGAGKTTLGRILARRKACSGAEPGQAEACDNCDRCNRVFEDLAGSYEFYDEWDANCLDADRFLEIQQQSQDPHRIVLIDELQDLSPRVMKQCRKLVEGSKLTLIVTTTHVHEIDDALMNRLKSYHYILTRPTAMEVVEYLAADFTRLSICYSNRSQLLRIAESLDCEMRPIAKIGKQILAETPDRTLSDDYLDSLFGKPASETAPVFDRRRMI